MASASAIQINMNYHEYEKERNSDSSHIKFLQFTMSKPLEIYS